MSLKQTVLPKEIESKLTRIWDDLQGSNKMRASLFNLIIYCDKSERESYYEGVIQKLIQRFPARILFVALSDEKIELKTSVSVLTAEEGASAIACDLIHIEGGRDQIDRIPFILLPHILPDLPLYLVRGDDPLCDDSISIKLEPLAKRLIFDSENSSNLASFSQVVLDHQKSLNVDVADLNWARMESWRGVIHNVCHTKERLEMLKRAKELSIEYNAVESTSYLHKKTQAIYLVFWLSTQLNWPFKKIEKKDKELSVEFENLHCRICPSLHENVPPGNLLSFEMKTEEGEVLSIKRNLEFPQQVIVEHSTATFCEMPSEIVLESELSKGSLVREICHKGTSPHFGAVLDVLQRLPNEVFL
ncbi:MAG: glucose-6-phosphate dehydrogenase assembly protein OpcA [Simkaniaceae bacterium]